MALKKNGVLCIGLDDELRQHFDRQGAIDDLDAQHDADDMKVMSPKAEAAMMQNFKVTAPDMVNLPPHYARFKIEPIRFAVENNLNFLQSNAIKYVMRFDAKNGEEDLKKAIRCIEMLIKFNKGDPDWWQRG